MGDHVLLGIPCQGDGRIGLHAAQQELDLQGREILNLVHHKVTQAEGFLSIGAQGPDAKLPGPEQKRVVLGVEFGARTFFSHQLGEYRLQVNRVPVDEFRDVLGGKCAGCDALGGFGQESGLAQHRCPIIDDLLHPGLSGMTRDVFLEGDAQEGMEFDALDRGRGVLALGLGQLAKVAFALLEGPIRIAHDLNPGQPEGGQHMADEISHRPGEDHDHGLGRIDERIRERQIGDAVKRHGGLARSRCSSNDKKTRPALGDEFELFRIDQACDLRETLVHAQLAVFVVRAQSPRRAFSEIKGLERDAFTSAEARSRQAFAIPFAGPTGVRGKIAFRGLDSLKYALLDANGSPGDDKPDALAACDLLIVFVALAVAVKNFRDRCVAPVHDSDAPLDAGRTPEAEVPLLAVFIQAQVGEIRVHAIDLVRTPGTSQLAQDSGLMVILLAEGRDILGLVAREDDRTESLEFPNDGRFRGRFGLGQLAQKRTDLGQQVEFLSDDGIAHGTSAWP